VPVKLAPACRRAVVLLAATALALVGSCTFDFLNGGDDGEEQTFHYTYDYNTDETVAVMYCYDQDEVLQWSERYTYQEGNRTALERCSASDQILYTYLWGWEDGKRSVEAYFDGTSTLRWYDHFIYDGELLAELVEYDGAGLLQWFEVYQYSGSGKQTLAVRFNSASALVGATATEYDAEDRVLATSSYDSSGTLCAKVTHEWSSGGEETRRTSYAAPASAASMAPASRSAVAARAPTGLVLPVPPEPPVAPGFTLAERDLEVVSRRFWFYDAYGTTDVSTRADYLPTAVLREDIRLAEAVSVALAYDDADRILSKTTSYGDTEALKIALTYEAPSGWRVSHIQSSGAAMLLPLDFDLSWDEAGVPVEVVVSYDASTLFTLSYDYDPLDLHTHTITVVDGDDELYGCYVFTLADDWLSGTIEVFTDAARTVPNGSYSLAYDEDLRTASFASYDAQGELVVRYEYGYEDLEGLGETVMVGEYAFELDAQGAYDAVMRELEASDFDFSALLRIRSAEDVARLFL
jgi:hypothetical protein